jgi:hypothetical protein
MSTAQHRTHIAAKRRAPLANFFLETVKPFGRFCGRLKRQRMEGNMRYVTITTWEIADGTDYNVSLRAIEEKRLPALKSFGASRITVIRTSERTSAAITEWPDKATRDAAELKIDEVRRSVHKQDLTRMTGEMKGEIVADL